MSTLICKDITKSYSKKPVLTGVTFTLEPHKVYGLFGRNGIGKTTLLGIISGQNPSDGGGVTVDSESVWQNQRALDEICFSREINPITLFGQDARKVKEVLKLAQSLFKYWDNDYAGRLIAEFNLEPKSRISKLSKGMLSALTIVIALASKAPMTFIDEPVAGLDVFMRDKFYKLLAEEYANTQRTFVISTHIIDEVSGIVEDVIILKDGGVLKNESLEGLLGHYRIVSGKDSDIDEFSKGYKVVHSESLLKNKTICVEVDSLEAFKTDVQKYNFDVSQASLQKLLMQLL
ncbi:MAG: ABC transporter ATP-binding protein [Oscillospiraceae bacterium]